jgi:DNA polymerase III epsilon subunit-like protein
MLADKTPFAESKDTFQAVIDGYANGFLVAHNHFYDRRVLENHGIDMGKHKWICTWRMAKKLFNGVETVTETNLPYLRFALELEVPLEMRCHRAGVDSYITGRLLETFVDYMEELGLLDKGLPYGAQISTWAAGPIIYERMPFGKHKNEKMADVPRSYWQWAMKNTDWFNDEADTYDPDLAESILAVLDLN